MSQFNLFSNHVNGNLKFLPRLHFTINIHANCKTVTTVCFFLLTDEGKMVEVESDLLRRNVKSLEMEEDGGETDLYLLAH